MSDVAEQSAGRQLNTVKIKLRYLCREYDKGFLYSALDISKYKQIAAGFKRNSLLFDVGIFRIMLKPLIYIGNGSIEISVAYPDGSKIYKAWILRLKHQKIPLLNVEGTFEKRKELRGAVMRN